MGDPGTSAKPTEEAHQALGGEVAELAEQVQGPWRWLSYETVGAWE